MTMGRNDRNSSESAPNPKIYFAKTNLLVIKYVSLMYVCV